MNLAVVAEYVKLREQQPKLEATAKSGAQSADAGTRAEAQVAAKKAADALGRIYEIEESYPDIRAVTARVLKVLEPGAPAGRSAFSSAFGSAPAEKHPFERTIENLFNLGAEHISHTLAEEVRGAGVRRGPLEPGEFVVDVHDAAPGQVCVEVRMRAADALQARRLAVVIEDVETMIVRTAKRA